MKKRGQLTAFVLVGFVILIAIVLLTVLYMSLARVSVSNKQFVNDKIEEVNAYVKDCLENGLVKGLRLVGTDGIEEYMKSINCLGVLGSVSGIEIYSTDDDINASLNNDKIDAKYFADISINKGSTTSSLNRLDFSYNLYQEFNVDKDKDGKADTDLSLGSFAGVGVLTMPRDIGIEQGKIVVGIKPRENENMLSDIIYINPENDFNPFAALNIVYSNCIDGNTAIINRQTLESFQTSCLQLNENVYAISEIKESSEYFVGSCSNFRCCWNGNCNANTGESCSNCAGDCGTCSVANEGSDSGSGGDQPSDQQQEQPPENLPPEQGVGGW